MGAGTSRERKQPGAGPGGSRRPSASQRAKAFARQSRSKQRAGMSSVDLASQQSGSPQSRTAGGLQPKRSSRVTGRAAILVLVLAVLTVSYASSMRAYLQQRSHIAGVKEQIVERQASLKALEREKRRWEDPAYVQIQARKRFGYVLPGETGVQVIDVDGNPLGTDAALPDPDEVGQLTTPTPWWDTTWESVELAGHPPKPTEEPVQRITPQENANGGRQDDQ